MKKALKKGKHKKGANVLKRQKQTVKKAYLDYLWVTVILVVMALAVLAVALFGGDAEGKFPEIVRDPRIPVERQDFPAEDHICTLPVDVQADADDRRTARPLSG